MRKNYTFKTMTASIILAVIFSFNAFAQGDKELELKEILDISYYDNTGETADLTKLNIVIPEGAENAPVLFWVGGGAWAYVDRNKEMSVCREIAEEGVICVSVGHRLSPALIWEPKRVTGIKHPEHVKDLAKAFKWVYENIEKYGGSKENIFIGGFSSGAHLTALLATDARYLESEGISTDLIKGVIPVAGCYDVPHYKEVLVGADSTMEANHINPVFGETLEEQEDASPKNYIEGFDIPMLILSEGQSYIYSEKFEELLNEQGCRSFTVLNAHKETHASLWKSLGNPKECIYRNHIVDFIMLNSQEGE